MGLSAVIAGHSCRGPGGLMLVQGQPPVAEAVAPMGARDDTRAGTRGTRGTLVAPAKWGGLQEWAERHLSGQGSYLNVSRH